MIRFRALLRRWRISGASVPALALAACMGGTGTDTENGLEPVFVNARVIDSSGKPLANVKINVMDISARADSVTEEPLFDPYADLRTNDQGSVSFLVKQGGKYIAEGSVGTDSVLFIDTLHTPLNPSDPLRPGFGTPEFTASPPIRALGRIRLLSGFNADSGRVFLRGTKRQAAIAADGTYDFAWLPRSAEKMTFTVVFASKTPDTRFVKLTQEGASLSVLGTDDSSCPADTTTATTQSTPVQGSLDSPGDLSAIVGSACSGNIGAFVTLLQVDTSGTVVATLGEYVIPDSLAFRGVDAALPGSCVMPDQASSGRVTLDLDAGMIVVDDLRSGAACR